MFTKIQSLVEGEALSRVLENEEHKKFPVALQTSETAAANVSVVIAHLITQYSATNRRKLCRPPFLQITMRDDKKEKRLQ